MKELNLVIAQNLIDLRKRHKLTQVELAERLNYTDKAVSKWEHGDSLPGIDVLYQLCCMYGVTLDDLVHEHTEALPCPPSPAAPSPRKRQQHYSITLLSVLIVWLVASFVYVPLNVFGGWNIWILFCWAVPASSIVLIVFNCIWGSRNRTYVLVSLLVWSLLFCFCLQFLQYRVWMLMTLGVPLQIGIFLWHSLDKARLLPKEAPAPQSTHKPQ